MAVAVPLIDFPVSPTLDVERAGPTYLELTVTPVSTEDAPVDAVKLRFKATDWTERSSVVLRKLEVVSSMNLELAIDASVISFAYPRDSTVDFTVFEPLAMTLRITELNPDTTYEFEVEAVNYLGSSAPLTTSLTTLKHQFRALYVWGNNTDSELGFQNEGVDALSLINQPIRHPEITSPLSFIVGGRQRSAAITADGEILEWGRVVTEGDDKDQLCEIISSPVFLELPCPMAFTKLALGASFGLALSVTGTIYSWGVGECKELAQANLLYLLSPEPIQPRTLPKFKDVAAGINSCCACTFSGELFEWGLVVQPYNGQPIAIQIPTKLSMYEVVAEVRAGSNTRAALLEDGSVYTWGFNLAGELGHGCKATVPLPRKVEGLPPVADVACGVDHNLFLDRSGSVWSCGSGKKGELGIGDCRTYTTPMKVPSLSDVKSVSAGLRFSLFMLKSGEVFSCGEGKNACLGIGVPGKASAPRKVRLTASAISAGIGHCLALLE